MLLVAASQPQLFLTDVFPSLIPTRLAENCTSSAPSRGAAGIIEEYRTKGYVVVTTPPPVDQQITAIENALKTVLGDISVALGSDGKVFVVKKRAFCIATRAMQKASVRFVSLGL